MRNGRTRCDLGLTVLLVLAVPIQGHAESKCWTRDQVRAAETNDYYTIIMTGALLCRAKDETLWPRYAVFLGSKRVALGEMNAKLKSHFAEEYGTAGWQNAVDSYVTKVGNRYGAGVAGIGCSDIGSLIDAAIAAAPTMNALADLAEAGASDPLLDAPRCDAPIAPLVVASIARSAPVAGPEAAILVETTSVSLVPASDSSTSAGAAPQSTAPTGEPIADTEAAVPSASVAPDDATPAQAGPPS